MSKIRTHYDNLKVARNAPSEVIRAAYRTLSQKYHPDVNPNNPDAHRIMGLLNAAYEILYDPIKRKDYDEWITRMEYEAEAKTYYNNTNSTPPPKPPRPQPARSRPSERPITPNKGFKFDLSKHWGWLLIAVIFILAYAANSSTPKKPVVKQKPIARHKPVSMSQDKVPTTSQYMPKDSPITQRYIRPTTAPNGQSWPNESGYIKGYKILHTDGRSSVTIDNSQNDSDVFVKLVSIDTQQPLVVRYIYIAPKGKFIMALLPPGIYDVRYRDLESGSLLKTESFQLEEISLEDRVQYSTITMTLYKVVGGNMRTTEISDAEFGFN